MVAVRCRGVVRGGINLSVSAAQRFRCPQAPPTGVEERDPNPVPHGVRGLFAGGGADVPQAALEVEAVVRLREDLVVDPDEEPGEEGRDEARGRETTAASAPAPDVNRGRDGLRSRDRDAAR
mgnify:CR=1 FL=1